MISLTGIGGGVVAWFTYILEAPYPGRISGGTLEIGPTGPNVHIWAL